MIKLAAFCYLVSLFSAVAGFGMGFWYLQLLFFLSLGTAAMLTISNVPKKEP